MNTKFSFSGVEQTVLLPLWGRVKETNKPDGIIKDLKAVELAGKINLDLTSIESEQNPVTQLAWAARAFNIDCEIKEILQNEKEITVINPGCGFDTSYFRINDPLLYWYDIDLPSVIAAKKKLIPEEPHYKMISGSVLEKNIFNAVEVKGKPIVVAVGLLYYFNETELRSLFANIKERFGTVLVIAEVFSPKGVELANKKVIKNIEGAKAVWGVKSKKEISALNENIRSIEMYPVFKKVRRRVDKKFRKLVYITDFFKVMSFAKIYIGNQ